jgi:hypothetical protein
MSASQRGQPGQGSFELGSKKKFGKNLNKLQKLKPPSPPITNGASQRGSGSSRNGLLLLSTKRSSLAGTTLKSGLLSSKPAPGSAISAPTTAKASTAQPVSIRNESYTSAHDALVDAVMGASRSDAQKEPAWGVADKQSEEAVAMNNNKVLAPGGGVTSRRGAEEQQDSTTGSRFENTGVQNGDDFNRGSYQPANTTSHQRHGDRYEYQQGNDGRSGYNRPDSADSWRRSESDENWRRNQPPDEAVDNAQAEYMARLARERAERRRLEEETRMNEQRERAARRLRELEHKIAQPANDPEDKPESLETLGPNEGADANSFAPRGNGKRTLYDPSRPFSSLLGGNSQYCQDGSSHEAPTPPVQHSDARRTATEDDAPSGPVIHLASYDDRDRGERNTGSSPRMLYDPKSGSMVTVNDKAKKGKQKGRNADESVDAAANGKKKIKGRNELASAQKKDRRRGDSIDAAPADETKSNRKTRVEGSRLPRTCGVLYVRDEKGNCYAADGCDGDQGYGCHGVPGGRMRNPTAFSKFQEEQLAQESEVQEEYGGEMEEDHQQHQHDDHMLQGYMSPEKVPEPVIDWVKPNEKIELLTGIQDSPTLQATAVPWAPTHAAFTAATTKRSGEEPVAESNVSVESAMNQSIDDELADSGDVSCLVVSLTIPSFVSLIHVLIPQFSFQDDFMGLGFDPSNMDSVMSSPSVRGQTSRLEAMDLGSLSLGVSSADSKPERQPSNIFAFGSSATWGSAGSNSVASSWTGNNNAGSSDWASLGTAIGTPTENPDKPISATSFLSLSSNNTWGTAGLPGFGGSHAGD